MNLLCTVVQPVVLVTVVLLSLAGPARSQHAGCRMLAIAGDTSTTVADRVALWPERENQGTGFFADQGR
jgi:hypothetical protein